MHTEDARTALTPALQPDAIDLGGAVGLRLALQNKHAVEVVPVAKPENHSGGAGGTAQRRT